MKGRAGGGVLDWFSLDGPGGRWRFVLVDPSTPEGAAFLGGAPRGKRYVGMTLPAIRTVAIDASEPRATQDETLTHELEHVALVPADLPLRIEERVVEPMAPGLLPLLSQLGMKFPPRPRGAAALEKRARRARGNA